MKKIFFMMLMALIFTSKAYAWSQIDKITEIKVAHGNKTLIKFQNATWQGCSASPFFIISEGDNVSDQRKQMYSIALTAMMTGKNVWIVTGGSEGDTPSCNSTNEHEWVYQISMYP